MDDKTNVETALLNLNNWNEEIAPVDYHFSKMEIIHCSFQAVAEIIVSESSTCSPNTVTLPTSKKQCVMLISSKIDPCSVQDIV